MPFQKGVLNPRYKHGATGTKLFKIYLKIIDRCNNPRHKHYSYYGGRGIKMEWDDFNSFREDMGKSFSDHIVKYGIYDTSIDRINSDGNYKKDNCRWATKKEQMRNLRTTREYKGDRMTVNEFANKYKIKPSLLWYRLSYKKWDIKKSIEFLTERG